MEPEINDFDIAVIFLQYYLFNIGARTLYLIVFHSRKIIAAKYNYGIGDKKLLVIINAFCK